VTGGRTTTELVAERDWLAERFEDHRPRLRAVAYRMLGSLTEADDAVQDAWLRLSRTNSNAIDNLGGWLTTVVARLALDMLRARAARREDLAGERLPEPVVTSADASVADPEQQALLADSVGLAMLVVLETLTPAERLAFVLHDTFGLRFDEIAPIVERSPTATRQLASRARRRVRGARVSARASADVSPQRQRELVNAFLAAARGGDFEALLRVLDPDVVVRGDVGAGLSPTGRGRSARGADEVARQAVLFRSVASGARAATVNGTAGLVVFVGERPFAVMRFAFRRELITGIDIFLDPATLRRLDLSAVATPPGAA
jgi:RNA polymerase sigma-70 factor (ECF subfamily)